jgi:hypothetical protein
MTRNSAPPPIAFPTGAACTRFLLDVILSSRGGTEEVRQDVLPDWANATRNAARVRTPKTKRVIVKAPGFQ